MQPLDLLRLIRVQNCAGGAVAAWLGAHLSRDPPAFSSDVLLAQLTAFLAIGACNACNDLCDVETDRRAKPDRPLPSGRVSPSAGDRVVRLFAVAACVCAGMIGAAAMLFALCALAVGFAYSLRLKSTVLAGNAVVALLSASTILLGGVAAGGASRAAWTAAVLVFLFVFAREVLKAIADREGDALSGVRTVATTSPIVARRWFEVLALTFVVAALLASGIQNEPRSYLMAMLPLAVLPTLGILLYLRMQPTPAAISATLGVTKVMWFAGLLAMSLLR